MSGKARPSLIAKTLENVKRSSLSQTDKDCIQTVFETEHGELRTVIKMLKAEYEKAKLLKWVNNPLAYALYQVWKLADRSDTE